MPRNDSLFIFFVEKLGLEASGANLQRIGEAWLNRAATIKNSLMTLEFTVLIL